MPRKRKKVLVFRRWLLPISETFIYQQVLNMKRWDPVLVGDLHMPHGLKLEGVRYEILSNIPEWLARIVNKLKRVFNLNGAPAGLVERLRRENADLLHVHFGTDAVRYWSLLDALDLPVLITLWGYDINTHKEHWEAGRGGDSLRQYPRRLLELAQNPKVAFLACSEAIRAQAIRFGIPAGKVTVCGPGIDTKRFAPAPVPIDERSVVLFVGRLVEKKGLAYLLEAFAGLGPGFPDAELRVIGDGPLKAELMRRAQALSIRASFLGAVPSERVRKEMERARILCLPSVRAANGDAEGFGVVILEAQASGVPVITSALGGKDEGIIHGVTGIAHKERDVDAIRRALANLLTDDKKAMRFSAAARRFAVKTHDIRACTAKLESIYDRQAVKR